MAELRKIAVIDIGKTNAKVVLVDRLNGTNIDAHSIPNRVLSTPPYPHYDTDGLWKFILAALKQLQSKHGIDGISITTHGAAAALVNAEGLVLPVLDYEFDGPEAVAPDYAPPEFSETLSPRLPVGLNLGAQIFWQSKTFRSAFAQATAILMYPQFWAWKLTGVMASEVTSLGTHTDLWNPERAAFSSLVERENWTGLFPPMQPAVSVLGPILPELAAQVGLPSGTPVACGIHDSNASLLPYLKAGPLTIISSGTWTIVMTIGGDTSRLDPSRDCLANVDAFKRPVPTARFMGGREYEVLMDGNVARAGLADIQAALDTGQMVMPGWAVGVGPFPVAKGRWLGAFRTDAERAAAVVLYMALMSQTCLSLAGVGEAIVVEGPLAKNQIYCGILAALTGKPIYRSGDATGTSNGAAMLFGLTKHTDLGALTEPLDLRGLQNYTADWAAKAAAI
ncbi:MAG: FGGY-family carbohydrate kinase [Rhodobacteraceae bacterium]|nr:FGGY-family carbohydrate kinase [Paracoccaceae bacterium]